MAISLLKGSSVTRFATVWPAEKLTLEVPGGEPLSGYTIRTPPAFGCVTVTLRAKADGNVVHVGIAARADRAWGDHQRAVRRNGASFRAEADACVNDPGRPVRDEAAGR